MSWYKNIYAFKLNSKISEDSLKGLEKIVEMRDLEFDKIGWSTILDDGQLYQKASSSFLVQLQVDKKNIPSSTIKVKVDERMKELKEQGEKPKKAEVKEVIKLELAKNALVSSSFIQGYFDNKNSLLVINTSSAKQADLFVEEARKKIEDLDIDIIEPDFDVGDLLTKWVKNKEADEPFEIEDTCVLTDINSGSTSTYKKQDLSSEEIEKNISFGKAVSSLRLNWHERILFTLDNDFKIKQVKPDSSVGEGVSDEVGDDDSEHTMFVASMSIMVEDFAELITDLISKGE
jgi:recombination associated protein RdgC